MVSNIKEVKSLLKTSRIILGGIFLQATLFAFWGLSFFISGAGTPTPLGPTITFSVLALASFAYGIRFYPNFSLVRKKELLAQAPKKRKESLLLIAVIHFLLLEFICVLGIILAIFLQDPKVMYPFYIIFCAGLAFSIPKEEWFSGFFKAEE